MFSIELFAGAGGLALGLEQAGFEHIGLIEFNRDAAKTLITNRPQWNVLCEDIAQVAKRDLEEEFGIKKYELDLLSGGAPCAAQCFIIMQPSFTSCNRKCSCLKMCADC